MSMPRFLNHLHTVLHRHCIILHSQQQYDCFLFSISPPVHSLNQVRLCECRSSWNAGCQASLFITSSGSLLQLMSIVSVISSNNLILCHRLLLPPSIFSSIRVFSNESVLCMWQPKYWSFSFLISISNEYSALIFRMDWLDLLAV